ncbi:MAG TPA: prolyl oligopeptidase family serine peptidase [Thermoanaerobaculia bacterium]|nr:prolyl oligopeptidase family serine peptidase [Thermoanaerobaculia bacterium]
MFSSLRAARLAALLLFGGTAAVAASPRLEPLPVETALSEKSLGLYSPPSLSRDGQRVAYTICDPHRVPLEIDPRYQAHSRTGVTGFGIGCDVWVAETAGGEPRRLGDGTASSWAPRWSPDGSRLAFYSDRSGVAGLWTWTAASGETRRLSDAIVRPWGASPIAWTSDSRAIAVPLVPEGKTLEDLANLAAPAPKPPPSAGQPTVTVFEFRPKAAKAKAKAKAEAPAAWSLELLRSDVALVDASSGAVRRVASNGLHAGLWISPDGARLAYTAFRGFEAAQSQQQLFDLRVVDLARGDTRTVAESIPQQFGIAVAWSPDSRSLAYLTTKGECFVVSASGGAPRLATTEEHPPFLEDDSTVPIFASRGDALYFLAADAVWRIPAAGGAAVSAGKIAGRELRVLTRGRRPDTVIVATRDDETKKEGLAELDLRTGGWTRFFEAPVSLGRDPAFRIAASPGGVVFAQQDARRPEDLWFLGVQGGEARRITRLNPAFEDYVLGESRLIEWRSTDGKPLRGALLLPAGYVEGRRYPLVVFVYGGARLSNGLNTFGMRDAWDVEDDFQLLATRGYAVLLPDAPSDRKDQMRDLPRSVLPGVNRVVDLGIADTDRTGVMGHSNGGYSTLALITLTTRFKAAVMRAGMGNFLSFYGELGKDGTHYGLGVAESAFGMGDPWTARSRYLENSPVLYLDRVETPLLIVHGSEDDAVAVHLAEEVFVDLRRLGKEVVFARYEGEGHSLESDANRRDYVNRMIGWFDEHLKGEAAAKPASAENISNH